MGDLIPLASKVDPFDDSDILTDIYMQLNMSAGDLGYEDDRIGWLRRLERILTPAVHTDYTEFTEGMWPDGHERD